METKPWFKKTTFWVVLIAFANPWLAILAKKLGVDVQILLDGIYGVLGVAGIYITKEGVRDIVNAKAQTLTSIASQQEKKNQ